MLACICEFDAVNSDLSETAEEYAFKMTVISACSACGSNIPISWGCINRTYVLLWY